MASDHRPVFLTAEWRHLLMVNYAIDPARLAPFVPGGTELDTHEGTAYLSLVGFRFLRTRVKGFAVPFHTNFEEINLRFYVRRKASEGWRRGVVFIKEIVPRRAVAWLANTLFDEQYVARPTRHSINPSLVEYAWRNRRRWNRFAAEPAGAPRVPAAGSHEQFISEHYWGYTAGRSGRTVEYQVEHPSWTLRQAVSCVVDVAVADTYGSPFVEAFQAPPASVFIADGSAVAVSAGKRIAG